MKLVLVKKIRRFIPDYELLADLCAAALRLRTFSVSIRQYQRLGEFNPSTIIARFGSWNRACELTGLRAVKTIRPSHTELMSNLAAVWNRLGRQPRMAEMTSRISEFSRHSYTNRYGSWYNTLTEFEKYNRCLPFTKGEYPPGGGGLKQDMLLVTFRSNTNNGENKILPLTKGECPKDEGVCMNFTPRYPGLRLRMEVLKRDRYKCRLCGRSPAEFAHLWLEIDHIKPWSQGGKTEIGNLQTLCNECNRGKGDLNSL